MNLFSKFINYFKKETLVSLFFIALICSWGVHISFRNEHFQEGDSSGTYSFIYEFPAATLRSTALSYPKGNFLSIEKAREILKNPTVKSIKSKYLKSFTDEFILDQLTKSSALATFRYALIQGVTLLQMPFPIQSFFATGLGSTYSSGVGLLYGLVGGKDGTYEDFMSRNMVISITLFHLAILLLFLILRKVGTSNFISVFVSLLAIFSISLYSSGIHIGSTVWNFTTELFWIWYLLKNIQSPKFLKKISWLSGVLIFFNYLILFFWLAFLMVTLKEKTIPFSQRRLLRNALDLIREQWAAIILIGACAILFVQPGQGFRGQTHLIEIPKNIYYIILNFFSWYTHSPLIDAIQFGLGILFVFAGGYFIFRKQDTKERKILKNIIEVILILYVILVCIQTLSFTPTRHILFLFPIIYLSSGIGLNFLIEKINKPVSKYLQTIFLLSLIILGFTTIKIRQIDTLDRTKGIQIDNDISMIGIYDSSYNIYYTNLGSQIPVTFVNPKTFKTGETYLYVSQSEPFDFAYNEWLVKYHLVVEKVWEKSDITEAYFTAYNPDFKHSRYSRPNNFFQTKFKVISINQK